jgi:hypothetical protein
MFNVEEKGRRKDRIFFKKEENYPKVVWGKLSHNIEAKIALCLPHSALDR